MSKDLIYGRDDAPFPSAPSALLHEREEWGLRTVDLVNPPRRFWADQNLVIPAVEAGIDYKRVRRLPTPAEFLAALPPDDTWGPHSRRSIARLQAHFLVCEDPQRRMDAREVETLAHQISLVRHVLESDHLRRVLIADEVGLGKTVEVGLLIKELIEQEPGLRVLYLSPARLVNNVRREFDRIGVHFRQWTASDADARLTDPRILASIHRAVHGANFDRVTQTDPWDLIVVDECHHLSAWEPGGGDPREAYKLVRELIRRQRPGGRVVLLSGTPHQGSVTRFENLLALLRDTAEPPEALAGRVIYRTKDDVRDWRDNPLFPPRQVNEPLVIDLGPRYRTWIDNIHAFYRPPKEEAGAAAQARRRAAGWRCAQALQWAASSPQAGLGYLVRQAVRAGWDMSNSPLRDAVAALRPYRLGSLDEPVEQLFARLLREVTKQREDQDVEDIEDEDESSARSFTEGLEQLLTEGLQILRQSGDEKWQLIKERLLDAAGTEKVVLFAQPIETVVALTRFLERTTGRRPALIIGGQSDTERGREVESFRRTDGPQFLVSSRAGGEGLNLQVARRLVHIDVPWNPMDLEQRVGRVHRFGSRRTILVDTVVVKDSREADAFHIARQKLELIAATLVERDRFEAVFARVMCLVPPEDLQTVMIRRPHGPFDREDQDQIARMVQLGFQAWNEFHERFGARERQIRQQDPGLAAWADVVRFLRDHAKANPTEGFKSQRFVLNEGITESVETDATVLTLEDGSSYVCGDDSGAFVCGTDGLVVRQLGLNLKPVSEALRRLAFPTTPVGAAHLRWSDDHPLPPQAVKPFGVLVFLRQTVRTDPKAGWVEQASSLHCYVLAPDAEPVAVDGSDKGVLLRGLFGAGVRNKPELVEPLLSMLATKEIELANHLRRPSDREMRFGVRHAVTPLFAAIVT
jgi:superfamily II DNA or RNA helicase